MHIQCTYWKMTKWLKQWLCPAATSQYSISVALLGRAVNFVSWIQSEVVMVKTAKILINQSINQSSHCHYKGSLSSFRACKRKLLWPMSESEASCGDRNKLFPCGESNRERPKGGSLPTAELSGPLRGGNCAGWCHCLSPPLLGRHCPHHTFGPACGRRRRPFLFLSPKYTHTYFPSPLPQEQRSALSLAPDPGSSGYSTALSAKDSISACHGASWSAHTACVASGATLGVREKHCLYGFLLVQSTQG